MFEQEYVVRELFCGVGLWQVTAQFPDGSFVVIATCNSSEKAEALRELLDAAASIPANSHEVDWSKFSTSDE